MGDFRLLRRLGCGDIGTVYLSELSKGGGCGGAVRAPWFAMKVMDKASLESRRKLSRAETEREILQLLDHPFLPTLYAHFETDKFACLVMEFCPGGDLHALRQRQPGKLFPEHAARYYIFFCSMLNNVRVSFMIGAQILQDMDLIQFIFCPNSGSMPQRCSLRWSTCTCSGWCTET
jgi:hypothetical protein